MTTATDLQTITASNQVGGCPHYCLYAKVEGKLRITHLPATGSSAPNCPDSSEHLEWVEHRSGPSLPSTASSSGTTIHAGLTSLVEEHPLSTQPASSTSDAINQELMLESTLVWRFEEFVQTARNEQFADGMDSTFASRVHDSILHHGSVAVAAWERMLMRTGNMYETGEELLRQLGLSEHVASKPTRLRVLMDSTTSNDARIRDAASLGLAFLDDPAALPAVRQAYAAEQQPWLRESFNLVIAQLEGSK